MTEVTVAGLDALVAKYRMIEAAIDSLEEQIKPFNKELQGVKSEIATHLAELDREEYVSPHGKVKTVQRWQTKMPQTVEAKALLWEWMRAKGIYDAYATVHATALNSLFLKERELAVEEGGDQLTFALPGMDPATLFEDIKLTKK